jgi:hypothetical protein
MKRFSSLPLWFFFFQISYGQTDDSLQKEAERILHFLASDSLNGRGNLTKELHKAAYFIVQEFI